MLPSARISAVKGVHRVTRSLPIPGILILCFFAGAFAAWPQKPDSGLGEVVDRSQAPPPEALKTEKEEEGVEDVIESLPLEARVAQLMLVTLQGINGPSNADRQLIRDFPPGGVIIPHVTRPGNAADYIRALRSSEIEALKEIPLLIGTDAYTLSRHEERPIGRYMVVPSMLTMAAAGRSDPTLALARLIAGDLETMGFNLLLGPSLELANQVSMDKGTLDNFGPDPSFIAAMAREIASAMSENGILWLPLGFPGGGENRDQGGPAVLLTPKSQLRERDLLPYEAAIEAGAQIIHVGNALVPTLDRNVPASLSSVVINDVLHDILEFDGLVVAGPMDARDITLSHNPWDAALFALRAGADMIYWNESSDKVIKAVANIALAVKSGKLDEAVVDRAFERVLAFKEEHGLLEREPPKNKEVARIEKRRPKNPEPYLVERRAVTLIQNTGSILPLTEEDSLPMGVTGVYGVHELHDALEEYLKPVAERPIATAKHAGRIEDFEIERLVRTARGSRTAICIFANEIEPRSQIELMRNLKATGSRIVVVLIGYPSNMTKFLDADAVVLTYGTPASIPEAMRAVADLLVGNAPVEVLPALRDLERRPGQKVPFNVYDVIRSPIGRLPITIAEPYVAGYAVSYRPTLSLYKVRWDFGDGQSARDLAAVHAYAKPGRYEVTLTVETKQGETASGAFNIVVK